MVHFFLFFRAGITSNRFKSDPISACDRNVARTMAMCDLWPYSTILPGINTENWPPTSFHSSTCTTLRGYLNNSWALVTVTQSNGELYFCVTATPASVVCIMSNAMQCCAAISSAASQCFFRPFAYIYGRYIGLLIFAWIFVGCTVRG